MKLARIMPAAFACWLLPPATVEADPANTLRELWGQLGACMRSSGASDGSDVTVMFSLKRDGKLLGKPRISHAKLPTDAAARRRVVEATARALDNCLPVSITAALGGAIAGRPLTVRLIAQKKEDDI